MLAALPLLLADFTQPWSRAGWQQLGAYNALQARNFVEHGWLELKFAPSVDTAPPPDGQWARYMHHPPGTQLLTSLSFALFGVAEWSARLVPVLCSLAELLAVWALARRCFGVREGLVAAALFATCPATAHFGSLLDGIGPVLMVFIAAAAVAHLRELERRTAGAFVLQALAVLGACLVNWQGVEFAGVLALHYLLQRRPKAAAVLLLLGVGAVAAQAAHIRWVTGVLVDHEDPTTLWNAFLWRSWGGVEQFGGPASALLRLARRTVGLYTVPVCLLAAAGLLRLRHARWPWLLVGLLAFGLADMLIFLEGSVRHEYWATILAPGLLVLAAAVAVALPGWMGLERAASSGARGRNAAATAVLLLVVLACAGYGAMLTVERSQALIGESAEAELGQFIQRRIPEGQAVFTCESTDQPLAYYARHHLLGPVDDRAIERFPAGLRQGAPAWFVAPETPLGPHDHDRLLAWLRARHPESIESFGGRAVHLFDLSRRLDAAGR